MATVLGSEGFSQGFSTCEWNPSLVEGGVSLSPHRAQQRWTHGDHAGLSQRFSSLFAGSEAPLQAG